MSVFERFHELLAQPDEQAWCQTLFRMGKDLGFEHTLLALVPKPGMPLEQAFLRSNYATAWREVYDRQNMAYRDPTVAHCLQRTTSLVWSPEIFQTAEQKGMYEEACAFGLRSGVTLPIHGPRGEVGILCFVNDARPGNAFRRDLQMQLPALSLLRDVVFESGAGFAAGAFCEPDIPRLTDRELECLKWISIGKTTWEVSRILGCTEATVNFHVTNLRQKFEVGSRREAIVKAVRLGIIELP